MRLRRPSPGRVALHQSPPRRQPLRGARHPASKRREAGGRGAFHLDSRGRRRRHGRRVHAEARRLRHRPRRVEGDRYHRRRRESEIQGEAAQGLKMRFPFHRAALAAGGLTAILAGCAQLPRVEAPSAPPAEFPEAFYLQALKQGKPVFRVDSRESLVVIEVRRSGSLARLGHDHVVASHEVGGYVAPDEGRADLVVALARLAVDEPALRAEAGFDTQPTESDIEGTRANMLEKVLEAEKFPFALIGVSGANTGRGDVT